MTDEEYLKLRESGTSLFMHCKKCLSQKPDDMTPAEYQRLEVLLDREKGRLVAGCFRCDIPLMAIPLDPETKERYALAECDHCTGN